MGEPSTTLISYSDRKLSREDLALVPCPSGTATVSANDGSFSGHLFQRL
jgi:hypothetical protein